MHCLGVDDISQDKCLKLVGIGRWSSCKHSKKRVERSSGTAHCLELAIKEALKGTAFDAIYEFLLICILRTMNNRTPYQLWISGMMHNTGDNAAFQEVEDNPIVSQSIS